VPTGSAASHRTTRSGSRFVAEVPVVLDGEGGAGQGPTHAGDEPGGRQGPDRGHVRQGSVRGVDGRAVGGDDEMRSDGGRQLRYGARRAARDQYHADFGPLGCRQGGPGAVRQRSFAAQQRAAKVRRDQLGRDQRDNRRQGGRGFMAAAFWIDGLNRCGPVPCGTGVPHSGRWPLAPRHRRSRAGRDVRRSRRRSTGRHRRWCRPVVSVRPAPYIPGVVSLGTGVLRSCISQANATPEPPE
jgi:hypothetical protein